MPYNHTHTSKPHHHEDRWYFGGLAAAMASSFTYPLDLLKVHLQTQQEGKITLWGKTVEVVRSKGVFGLYHGISASLVRQLTYSTARFAFYETIKHGMEHDMDGPIPFHHKIILASISGAIADLLAHRRIWLLFECKTT